MEKKIFKFKTTLDCGGCVAKVTEVLDNLIGQSNWQVDTNHADKILTATTTEAIAAQIPYEISSKGFTISAL